MRVLYIEYALWKSITQARGFTAFHEVVTTDTRKVWSGMPEVVFAADVEPGADFTDWQANFGSSTLVLDEDSALANIAGLGQTLQPRAPDGTPISADQLLALGQKSFLRTDDGTELMNVNGTPSGAVTVLWNGTGPADTGGDWTASQDGSETAAAMRSGTNGWDSGLRGNNDNSRFSNGSEIDVAALYDSLSFWMNPQSKEANTTLEVQFYKAGTLVNNRLDIADYVTNFDIGIWQKITIPISDFGLTETVDQFRILYEAQGNKTQQYFFDDIEFTAAGGGGPYTFQVAAPPGERWHVSMLVFIVSGPSSGWTSTSFANIPAVENGLLLRQRRVSDASVLWTFNSKDNADLFGRYHPQDDIEFSDGVLLVGFMVKPGKSSILVTEDDVLEFVVRDDLSALAVARAYAHYGVEQTT